ncbi:high mobility group protein B1 [Octopus bimaculoides]|uniref:HMG box domain-containing protein n=1 Tax=Octopus bimaculoides TaxID=37653 RepID=A0A0L8GP81_OCTBM|nr:high mobility group protein B1 [Octopus bimaculoides]|eukprot:XP_014779380.1 PREDICTED: high mobility group protein B1-like [Octopus bimaculoides]
MGRLPAAATKGRKRKKPKDVNRPKRTTSAYFYYMAHCREQAAKSGKTIPKVSDFTKECSEKWKALTVVQKKPFEEKAAKDKARYVKEMSDYKQKNSGDPNKPKRPQSSYFLFLNDFRLKMNGKGIDHKEILRLAGEEWRKMTDEVKKPYEKRNREEKKKYDVAIAEYKKKSGEQIKGASSVKKAKVEEEEEEDEDDEEADDDEEEAEEEGEGDEEEEEEEEEEEDDE